MREILFRGKRKEDDEWVYGFLVSQKHIGDWVTAYPVVPNTVGQFTGRIDKNGKKIFEGDIIRAFGETYACRWDGGNCEFGLSNKHESFGIAYVAPFDMEIVGNIHDNPELLGGAGNAV